MLRWGLQQRYVASQSSGLANPPSAGCLCKRLFTSVCHSHIVAHASRLVLNDMRGSSSRRTMADCSRHTLQCKMPREARKKSNTAWANLSERRLGRRDTMPSNLFHTARKLRVSMQQTLPAGRLFLLLCAILFLSLVLLCLLSCLTRPARPPPRYRRHHRRRRRRPHLPVILEPVVRFGRFTKNTRICRHSVRCFIVYTDRQSRTSYEPCGSLCRAVLLLSHDMWMGAF